ncbi:hypothetical protein CWM58_14355 [Klebsiella sp. H-Nf2]|nr:hypothetical protein CWM58_14355 [Klebsiella sp. H-Nf2]
MAGHGMLNILPRKGNFLNFCLSQEIYLFLVKTVIRQKTKKKSSTHLKWMFQNSTHQMEIVLQ